MQQFSPTLPIYSLSNLSLDEPECLARLEEVIDRMIYENNIRDDEGGAVSLAARAAGPCLPAGDGAAP